MITEMELRAHHAAERWLWEAETGHETGPFWRTFVADLFRAAVQRFTASPLVSLL